MAFPDLTRALLNPCSLVNWGSNDKATSVSTEKHLVRLCENLQSAAEKDREPHERTWFQNAAFAWGHHHVKWNPDTRTVDIVKAPSWRVQHKVNLVAPALQREIAKLTRLQPKPEVIPESTDYKALKKATICQKILEAKAAELVFSRVLRRIILKAKIHSIGYLKVFWNSRKGEVYRDANAETGEAERFYEGDIDYDIEDPFTLFPEPGISHFDEASWCISIRTKSLGWALDRYPQHADKLKKVKERSVPQGGIFERFKQLFRGNVVATPSTNNVVVKEYWQKPDKHSDNEWKRQGLWFVVIDNFVADGPLPFPYQNGKLPYVALNDAWMEGLGYYGPTQTAQLLPMNAMINLLESNMMENLTMQGRPKWLVPRGCGLDKTAITTEPAEVIPYTESPSGAAPVPVRMPEPNAQSYSELANRQLGNFENVAGQHEVSRGVAPTGVVAGIALEHLQQADDTMQGPFANSIREFLMEKDRRILEIGKQFYGQDQREVTLYGKGGAFEVIKFSAIDISYREIRIEPNSLRPTSPMALREQIFRMAQTGLFGPYETPEHEAMCKRVIRLMRWGNHDDLFDDANKDKARTEWENDQLDEIEQMTEMVDPETGEVANQPILSFVPSPSDDDAEHIKWHQMRQKELSFNRLPESARLAHLQHVEEHYQNQVAKANLLAQIQAGMVGDGFLSPTSAEMAAQGMPETNVAAAAAQTATPSASTAGGSSPASAPTRGREEEAEADDGDLGLE